MNTQAITTVWAYLQRYDETGQPRYLISAFSIAYALLQQNKKKFSIKLYDVDWKERSGGKIYWLGVPTRVNEKNVGAFLARWEARLISRDNVDSNTYQFFLEVSKTNLQKLLVTVGAVENPFAAAERSGRFVLSDDEAEKVSEP